MTRAGRTPGGVLLDGIDGDDARRVGELMALVGAREWDGTGEPALILAGPRARGARGAMRLELGESGQLRLPADEALLAEALSRVAGRGMGGARPAALPTSAAAPRSGESVDADVLRIGVGTWSGGSGRLAALLAAGAGAVLVDASGAAPALPMLTSPGAAGVRWADLDPSETAFGPDLVDRLPRVGGLRVLGGDGSGAAEARDPRLAPVLRSLGAAGRGAVVDLGAWDARAHSAHALLLDGLVLAGDSDLEGASRLACALSLHPPAIPCVLVHFGRGRERIAEAAPGMPDLALRRAMRRGCRALLDELRRAGGRAWAGEFA